jgi:hypothetical protein
MSYKIKSFTVINGESFALATALGSRLSSNAKKIEAEGNKELSSAISTLANDCYAAIESGIAQATGSKKVKEIRGRGLKVDLINVNTVTGGIDTQEVKGSLIKYIKDSATSTVTPKRDDSISLGSDIRIGTKGAKSLTVGYSVNPDTGKIQEDVVRIADSQRFVNYYKDKPELLIQHMISPSRQRNNSLKTIVKAISKNLETKALTLTLPLIINGNTSAITTLQFTRKYILSNARVKVSADGKSILVYFKYPQSIINNALKNVAKRRDFKQAYNTFDSKFVEIVDNKLQSLAINPKSALEDLKATVSFISKSMSNKNFSFDLNYVEGSVVAYQGKIMVRSTEPKIPKKEEIDDRVKRDSIVDITVAVKTRVRQRMRRGTGVPRPTKIYERTGTFRNSVRAYFNFKQRTVDYFYEPYYQKLERSGYEITNLVEDSIRSVVQAKFKTQVTTSRIEL